MSIGIEPLGEMVLIELEQAAEKTASGFMLPEAAREKNECRYCCCSRPRFRKMLSLAIE